MVKVIEVSDSTYARLRKLMTVSDTAEIVIARLLSGTTDIQSDSRQSKNDIPRPISTSRIHRDRTADLEFCGLEIPNLTHTRLLIAYINDAEVKPSKWNQLRNMAITRLVKEQGVSAVKGLSGVVAGSRKESGFTFYPAHGISIQGQDANDAWRQTIEIARKNRWQVEAMCEWRHKKEAEYPGKTAILISRA